MRIVQVVFGSAVDIFEVFLWGVPEEVVCLIYLREGIVPTLWDAIFKKLRNSLGFNTSTVIVYVSRG